jgi:putative NADPH-quinone reductase
MKNFIDTNFWAWFAFKYDKWGKVVGLLKWKTARVFLTCDAPWFIYKYLPFANRLTGYFGMYVFGFCWMKVSWVHIFDNMHKKNDESSRNEMLKKVIKLAKNS